jgi:MoaA/NifB/PqqE/SkfB family radical SAM enzyme
MAGLREDRILLYDIEADWMLLDTCNYRCSYCFFPESVLGRKLDIKASPRQWQEALDATKLTWLLHITGGEPSVYPDFAELCRQLTDRHFISINSNVTNASFVDFAARVDPSRVAFINAGLHPEERARKSGEAAFLRHTELLRARGFPVMVSMVATPEVLASADGIVAGLRPHDIMPFPKLLRGPYKGRPYPDAYTYVERRRFHDLAMQAREANAELLARLPEQPTIDLARDDDFLKSIPVFTGLDCDAGVRFARMEGNGDLYRCSTKKYLGNVLAGSFARETQATPCDTDYCFYFCMKYTGHRGHRSRMSLPRTA